MATEDVRTQQHAHIIAHDYGIAPYEPLKTERVIGIGTDICSVFLANTDHTCKCFVQYHADELVEP